MKKLKVTYTLTVQSGCYFSNSFGNFLPSEKEIEQIAYVDSITQFDELYPYAESLVSTEIIDTELLKAEVKALSKELTKCRIYLLNGKADAESVASRMCFINSRLRDIATEVNAIFGKE